MRFDFFEKLSEDEAKSFLRRFLEVESSDIKQTLRRCAIDGIKTDCSIKSISPFMRWVLKKLITRWTQMKHRFFIRRFRQFSQILAYLPA